MGCMSPVDPRKANRTKDRVDRLPSEGLTNGFKEGSEGENRLTTVIATRVSIRQGRLRQVGNGSGDPTQANQQRDYSNHASAQNGVVVIAQLQPACSQPPRGVSHIPERTVNGLIVVAHPSFTGIDIHETGVRRSRPEPVEHSSRAARSNGNGHFDTAVQRVGPRVCKLRKLAGSTVEEVQRTTRIVTEFVGHLRNTISLSERHQRMNVRAGQIGWQLALTDSVCTSASQQIPLEQVGRGVDHSLRKRLAGCRTTTTIGTILRGHPIRTLAGRNTTVCTDT